MGFKCEFIRSRNLTKSLSWCCLFWCTPGKRWLICKSCLIHEPFFASPLYQDLLHRSNIQRQFLPHYNLISNNALVNITGIFILYREFIFQCVYNPLTLIMDLIIITPVVKEFFSLMVFDYKAAIRLFFIFHDIRIRCS